MRIRSIFKLWIIAAVVAIAAAALLAACSSEEESAAQPTATTAVQPTATTAPQPTATTAAQPTTQPAPTTAAATQAPAEPSAPRDVPRNRTFIGGKIGESLAGDPQNLNPYYSQLMNAGLHFLYESLYYLNIFDGELRPWLADGQPEWNDDFSSVTVTLKEGIKWSDGEPFTADDVVFSVSMVMENPTMLYSPNLNEFTAAVVAEDDRTVRFDLNRPNPRYILDFYGAHFYNAIRFVPEHIWKDVADVESFKNNDPATGLPVATGPYKYVRSGETEAIWDVRDDWWGIETGFKPRPQVERVIFIPMGTPDRQIALAVNNDLDWPETFSAGPYESIFARNPEWRAFTEDRPYGYVDACPFALHINHQSGALSDPDVRKAINWSLDKAKFVNLAHEGVTPTSGPDSWLEPFIWPNLGDLPGFRDRNRDIIEKHEVELHSPERANQILDEAGYSLDSDGYRVDSNGERLKVNITWVPTGYVEFPAPVESLVNDLRAVGFDAAQKQIQFAAFGEIATGGFDLALIWVCGSTKDPYATMDGFHPKYVPDDPTERVGSFSPSRWTGPLAEQYGEAVDKMAQIHPDDIEALDPLVREAMDLWLSEMVAVPLFQYPSIKPYNQTYWKGFPTDENPYNIPYLGWQSGITIITTLEPTQ